MNITLKLLFIFLAFILSSCSSLREWKEERRAARNERYTQKCLQEGFTKNTDAFRLCMQNLDIKRRLNNAAIDRIIKQNQQNSNNYINNLLYPKK